MTRMHKIESVSKRVSGGIPGYRRVWSNSLTREQGDEHTVASCANNLGVSFAQAFDAIVPSVGSSAVMVLRAKSLCHLDARENPFN